MYTTIYIYMVVDGLFWCSDKMRWYTVYAQYLECVSLLCKAYSILTKL